MTVQEDGDGADAIEISDEWWEKLTAMPFISCKWNECFILDMPARVMTFALRLLRVMVMVMVTVV